MATPLNILRLIEKEKQAKTGKLSLRLKGLTELPKELLEISHLKHLNLAGNKISDIRFLEKLTSLHTLELQLNQISDICFLEKLTSLHTLSLSNNKIEDIRFLEKLTSLHTLYLSNNQIEDYRFLEKLTSLHTLYLRNNQIQDITFLEKLTNLKSLYLNNNQIQDITFLEKLTKLNYLNLSNNQIQDITFLEKLIKLNYLNLSSNQIQDIRPLLPLIKIGKLKVSLKKLNFQEKFSLYDNPITTPPIEIVQQGNQAIIDWFAADKKELKEIKVILIGEGKAGKTSLLRRLQENDYKDNEEQTDGINIESIDFGVEDTFKAQKKLHELTGHFWDFGGQEIMNATHQFFLTKRSVYILVLDARKDNAISEQIKDWVKRIKSTGGNSSIIVVANKIDLNPGFGFVNQSQLQQEFPQIKAFLTVSCKDDVRIDQIKDLLEEWIPKAELFRTEIDERWIDIKDQLQEETEAEHFLPEKRFVEICEQHGLASEIGQGQAILFLHDLGLVMHFEGELSSAYYVLDPYWITYGVYQIVTSSFAAEKKGKVPFKELDFVINKEEDKKDTYKPKKFRKIKYDRLQRQFLVDILCQFKLCFKLPHGKHFILPNLLDTNEPNGLEEFRTTENRIEFVYSYDYLPKSVMPFIIVEKFNRIVEMWRTGCTLKHENCRALISTYNHELTLTVIGKHKQKRDFMSVLRYGVDKINGENLAPEMRIPLPIPKILPKKMYVSYQVLLKMEARGKSHYEIYEPIEKEFLISGLLEGITDLSKEEKLIRGIEEVKKIAQATHSLVKKTIEAPVTLQYPNVFSLKPKKELVSEESNFHSVYSLQFYCGYIGHEHLVGKPYEIKINKDWFDKALPFVNKVKEKYDSIAPLIIPLAFLGLSAEAFGSGKFGIKVIQDYVNKFEVLEKSTDLRAYKMTTADERAMEKIRAILEKEDKNRGWRDSLELKTKDGECFWVCREHAGEYD